MSVHGFLIKVCLCEWHEAKAVAACSAWHIVTYKICWKTLSDYLNLTLDIFFLFKRNELLDIDKK